MISKHLSPILENLIRLIDLSTAINASTHGAYMTQSATSLSHRTRGMIWFVMLALIGPVGLLLLQRYPTLNFSAVLPEFHFWGVLLLSCMAAGIAILILRVSILRQDARTFLIGLAFLLLASLFAIHALTTPGIIWGPRFGYISYGSTLFAFFVCACTLAASTSTRLTQQVQLLQYWKQIIIAATVGMLIYVFSVFNYLPAATQPTPDEFIPAFFTVLTWLSISFYAWVAWVYAQQWLRRPTHPLTAFIAGVILLAQATLMAQYGEVWQVSFWLYHILLSVAIIIIAYSALVGYERTGSLSSVVEGLMLASTLQRQQQGFRKAMEALLASLDTGDAQTFHSLRRDLGERFGLAQDQLDFLEDAITIVAQDREEEQRLHILADIGRSTTVERNPDELISNVLASLYSVTRAQLAAIGLINQTAVFFKHEHRLVNGQLTKQSIKAPVQDLPLNWFSSTDLPFQDFLPATLSQLTPYADQLVTQVPLLHRTELIGVLMYQPAPDGAMNTRMESVLQSIAAHISAALVNAQLYSELQAEHEQLRQSEHDREQLTQMIIHDLKNPLTAIVSYLEILRRDPLPLSQLELVDGALRNSNVMIGLVSDLLDSARLQDGRMELRSQPITGQELLATSLANMRGWANQDSKQITLAPPVDDWQMYVDTKLFQRILINLISNAIKHTPPHTHIEIGAAASEAGVQVWVKDNGPGIPQALIPHLFERFRTGDTQHRQRSTGLGLYFCKLAVEAHGGTIEVQSDQGTTFLIKLPAQVLLQPEAV